MGLIEERAFKYPAEDECLVRRLGSGVIAAWQGLSDEARQNILRQAEQAWDREYFVKRLPERLEAIIRRGAR